MATRDGFYFGQVDAKEPRAAYVASVSPAAMQPVGADIKFGASGFRAADAYLASIGESPLAKAQAALAAFAGAVAALDGIAKRIEALEAEPPEVDRETRLAKLNRGAQ